MNYHLATMTDAVEFPAWLQAELNKREWRPTDLAKRAKISDAAVSRFLSGERTPDAASLAAIAKAMKVRPEKVFLVAIGENNENESDEWVEEQDHKLRMISPKNRGIAGKLIDTLVQGEESEIKLKPKAKPVKA